MSAFFIFFLLTPSFAASTASPLPLRSIRSGHADECNALLRFKNSLKVNYKIVSEWICAEIGVNFTSSPKTNSWKEGTDCCRASWDGITCNNITGNVIGVDLTCSYLQGTLHSNSSLFSSLHHLQNLILRGNNLTGPIPSSICQKGSLEKLNLADNDLSGTIPQCLGNLTNLNSLDLSFNQLEGPFPRTLANCTSLWNLAGVYNNISDTFPFWLKSLPLHRLQLGGNNFHGQIITPGHSAFPFPHLEYLLLYDNQFHGQLPREYFLHSNLTLIDLSGNTLHGSLPIPSITTGYFNVERNNFTGEIHSSICRITKLSQIYMSSNSLTGKIPQCLINANTALVAIDLSMNRFRGSIPEILAANNCSLKSVVLRKNRLGGKLPRSWASCKQLEVLDIGDNEVEDTFPSWIETLPNLYGLVLRANKFHGPIGNPKAIHPFPQLQIFDISNNNFSGTFPSQYIANFNNMMGGNKGRRGYLEYSSKGWSHPHSVTMIYKGVPMQFRRIPRALVIIDLSCNHFQGEIPKVIGKLQSLIELNLSHSNFRGVIPSSIANLAELESLDLSSNNFTGEIPTALTNLTYLAIFNVSTNQLTGQIPRGEQFDTFKIDSFNGNPNLCGPPLPKPCTAERQQELPSTPKNEEGTESWIEWRVVLMGYGSGTVIGLSIGYIFIQIKRPPSWLIKLVKTKQSRTTNRPQ